MFFYGKRGLEARATMFVEDRIIEGWAANVQII
jgi:hypothetical protein